MFSNEIITKLNPDGECQIDIERVKREWHPHAWIYRLEERGPNLSVPIFRLIEFFPNGNNDISLKITIPREAALQLINDLGLIQKKEHSFASITYYHKPN